MNCSLCLLFRELDTIGFEKAGVGGLIKRFRRGQVRGFGG